MPIFSRARVSWGPEPPFMWGSPMRDERGGMSRSVIIAAVALAWCGLAGPASAASERACLDAAQTRAAVTEHKLANPVAAQRSAARHAGGGEFLRSRLCRWNGDYIYEISLLLRDGKVSQVNIRASDGKLGD
jgi:uncharacterized membrane protein YkoI